MRPIIYPYKLGSRSARVLRNNLRNQRCKIVRENGNYRPYRNHLVINWGNPRLPEWFRPIGHVLNRPDRVAVASNKLETFRTLYEAGIPCPDFVVNQEDIPEDWQLIIARTHLRGSSGLGISLINREEGETLPRALVYTRYEKKRHEFRVHVFNGEIIDIQQKRKRREFEDVDYKIRNHERGWVFCRQEVDLPNACAVEALRAIQVLHLTFGAVDIGWNEHYQRPTVYEINTAPGLEGSTVDNYVNAIRSIL